MSESSSHKRAKSKAAGKSGQTEVPLSKNRKLDAATKNRATEVERSGTNSGLKKAVERLRDSKKNQKVLQVPQKDMKKAVESMKTIGIGGTVKNMSGTRRISVPKKKKS